MHDPGTVAPAADAGRTLTVLGCDGSYPGPGGAASGYLVEGAGVVVWLDAGPGTFANLQLVTDPRRVDAVILSHQHPDHCSDIDSLAVFLHEAGPPARPVPVYAPPGVRARSYFADDVMLEWIEVEDGARAVIGGPPGAADGTGLRCTWSLTDHGPPTLAVRFDAVADAGPERSPPGGGAAEPEGGAGRSLAYTADTGPGWSIGALGHGIGMVLCEATFTAREEGRGRHLSGRQAGAMAAAAGVGQLVVTHRRPTVPAGALAAEADEAFGRPVHQAVTGRVFEW